jgi:hypothetical protein
MTVLHECEEFYNTHRLLNRAAASPAAAWRHPSWTASASGRRRAGGVIHEYRLVA